MIAENKKVCRRCKEEKTVNDFHLQKGGKYGVRSICKRCGLKYAAQYRKNNQENIKRYSLEYRKNNPEKVKNIFQNWRNSNLEKDKNRHKNYYDNNRELALSRTRTWRKNNSDKLKEYDNLVRENMYPSYVSGILNNLQIPITPETIELKRTQIKLKRIIKILQNETT